jgi:PAS domain S-box-containing protein
MTRTAPPIENEEIFRLLCQAAFDGILVHEHGTITAASAKALQMLRLPEEQVVGRFVLDFTDPAYHTIVLDRVATRNSEPFESVGVRGDGTRFPMNVCGVSGDGPVRVVALRDLTEQKRAENEAQRQAAHCRAVIQAAFEGILTTTGDRIDEVSARFAEMFGYTREELIGVNVRTLILRQFSRTTRGPARGLRKDGTSFPIEVAIGVTDDTQSVWAVRDVTDERRAEEELIESERRYREISESTHDLLCEHDLDGVILDVNPAIQRALGYTREEMVSHNIREFLDPTYRPHFDAYCARIQRDGVSEGPMRIRTRNGDLRIWHYRNALRSSGREKPVVRGLARDVTDRELAIRALRKSEQHFRSILEHISDTVTIVDAHGAIEYHSPSLERLLHVPSKELIDHLFIEFVHPEDVDTVSAFFAAQFANQGASDAIDVRIRHRGGPWRLLSMVATTRNIGGVSSLVVNGRDVTEKRLLVAQLEQANRVNSLGRLAATVAHEFNNVLMGMQPFAELMQRPGVDPATVTRGARSIINSIARGKRVTLDILRFTHPAQPTFAPVDLRTWWERTAPELSSLGGGIRIECTVPPRLAVTADAAHLTQLVSNLISNARDAMPDGGSLLMTARRPLQDEMFDFGVVRAAHRFVQLSVTDTGHGMSEEVVRHAFDPLFTTKLNGGTGLGLAVVHQIVSRHGGSIFIVSKPGQGTTFHVFLPAASSIETEEAVPLAISLNPLRVLVIDDEAAIADGLAELLGEFGATTEAAMTRDEAMIRANAFRPDLAVIDVRLSDGDGLELGAELRYSLPLLKVVYVSGHADARRVSPSERGSAFLQKPFEIGQLIEQITELTSER